jgi:DNA-binding CsgD family transcriptional regulator/tetratricopeptide (TPR) repeat protein
MEGSFTTSVICPVFIGRKPERDALYRLIDRTRNGQGQVALVCGEAGIGKSRLVAEAKAYAASQDFLLLQGNCFQVDCSYPYAPLIDLLRVYATPTTLASDLDSFAPEFARLLPELALSLSESLPVPLLDPEQEKRRLFVALTRFFTDQASQRPVLLVIEDLHWGDDISLEFLQFFARQCTSLPLLLLMTYRSDEVQSSLRRCLAQLDRSRLSQELALFPLSRTDVAAMLGAIFALREVEHTNLLDLIYPLTEGNPFFIEEVLTSLVSSGELLSHDGVWERKPHTGDHSQDLPVPRSVQDSVQQRTQQLSAEAMQVVTLAAVAGQRFDFAVLQQVMHCDEHQLLQMIKELMAIQFVVEISEDKFAFRHALTQQAIYTVLLVRERRSLHRTLVEAIEELCVTKLLLDTHLADLAYHYYEAGIWSKALEYEQRIGEQALALYAPQAAIEHFTRALTALHHLNQAQPSHLYRLRGQAFETLGEFERALSDYEHALEAARAAHDRLLEWQSMIALGFLWTERDYEQAGGWFRRASDLAEKLADPTLRARSLNRLGNWLGNTGRAEEGLRAHQEALSIFETRADTRGMAQTLDLLGTAHAFSGDRVNAVHYLGQAIELFRTLGDTQSLVSSLAMRAVQSTSETSETTFHALRTRDECMQDAAEALSLACQIDSLSGQAFAEIALSYVHSSFGELGQALTHAQEALRIATAIEHQQWMVVAYCGLGDTYLLLLQPALARAALEIGLSLARELGSAFLIGVLTALRGLAYVLEHDLPQAAATLTAVMPREQLPRTLEERQIAWVWGEFALAQGEPSRALQRAEHLLASAPGEQGTQPIPHLLRLKGEALMALSRFEEAVQAFEEAKRGAEMRHDRSILWRIHGSLGQVYHLLKREDQAQHECASAREIIDVLARTIDQTYLREHFVQAALQSLPSTKPLPTRRAAEKFDGLTEREIEVLRSVAQGLTDVQVAEQLMISPRTVHSHLNSIYSKLGITSRSAATRYAIEHSLS